MQYPPTSDSFPVPETPTSSVTGDESSQSDRPAGQFVRRVRRFLALDRAARRGLCAWCRLPLGLSEVAPIRDGRARLHAGDCDLQFWAGRW